MFPHRLITYRDGIAHSGFEAIGQPEIDAIHRVCRKLGISPALLIVEVD